MELIKKEVLDEELIGNNTILAIGITLLKVALIGAGIIITKDILKNKIVIQNNIRTRNVNETNTLND